jgi:hypothetical protein
VVFLAFLHIHEILSGFRTCFIYSTFTTRRAPSEEWRDCIFVYERIQPFPFSISLLSTLFLFHVLLSGAEGAPAMRLSPQVRIQLAIYTKWQISVLEVPAKLQLCVALLLHNPCLRDLLNLK